MKSPRLLLPLFFFILVSCSKKHHFSEFETLPEDHRWTKADKKFMGFEITDDSQLYDIVFKFSHVYDYQFSNVPIVIEIESPDKKTETLNIDLKIKDETGKQTADCTGDICDLDYIIRKKTKLQKGIYKVTIFHNFNGPYLPNVIGIGLDVNSVN